MKKKNTKQGTKARERPKKKETSPKEKAEKLFEGKIQSYKKSFISLFPSSNDEKQHNVILRRLREFKTVDIEDQFKPFKNNEIINCLLENITTLNHESIGPKLNDLDFINHHEYYSAASNFVSICGKSKEQYNKTQIYIDINRFLLVKDVRSKIEEILALIYIMIHSKEENLNILLDNSYSEILDKLYTISSLYITNELSNRLIKYTSGYYIHELPLKKLMAKSYPTNLRKLFNEISCIILGISSHLSERYKSTNDIEKTVNMIQKRVKNLVPNEKNKKDNLIISNGTSFKMFINLRNSNINDIEDIMQETFKQYIKPQTCFRFDGLEGEYKVLSKYLKYQSDEAFIVKCMNAPTLAMNLLYKIISSSETPIYYSNRLENHHKDNIESQKIVDKLVQKLNPTDKGRLRHIVNITLDQLNNVKTAAKEIYKDNHKDNLKYYYEAISYKIFKGDEIEQQSDIITNDFMQYISISTISYCNRKDINDAFKEFNDSIFNYFKTLITNGEKELIEYRFTSFRRLCMLKLMNTNL